MKVLEGSLLRPPLLVGLADDVRHPGTHVSVHPSAELLGKGSDLLHDPIAEGGGDQHYLMRAVHEAVPLAVWRNIAVVLGPPLGLQSGRLEGLAWPCWAGRVVVRRSGGRRRGGRSSTRAGGGRGRGPPCTPLRGTWLVERDHGKTRHAGAASSCPVGALRGEGGGRLEEDGADLGLRATVQDVAQVALPVCRTQHNIQPADVSQVVSSGVRVPRWGETYLLGP